MTAPEITVVVDQHSRLTPELRNLNSPEQGIVVGMVRPGARQTGWLANDLVAALGKTSGRGFSADGWAVAAAHLIPWFVVEEIEVLVVGYAETLPISQLLAITHLAALTEVSLWLVADAGMTDTLATYVAEFGATVIDAEDLGTPLTGSTASRSAKADAALTPAFPATVPDDTFLTFLATARTTMPEDDFAAVLALFVSAFDDTMAWLDHSSGAPSERDVALHVSSLLDAATSLASVTTVVRGVQAAAFRRGLLIRFDVRRFLNRMSETRTATDLHDAEWRLLGDNGNTRQCAIAVLAALGMSVTEIHSLPADRVAPDANCIRTETGTYQVPEAARPLLLAHLLYRACACDPSDPSLLAGSRKDAKLTVRGVSLLIDDVARRTGIAFRAVHDRWDADSSHWRQRSGILVTELAA